MFINGTEVDNDTTKSLWNVLAGDGRIVVGRYFTKSDEEHASVQVDEMIYFNHSFNPNHSLNPTEIETFSEAV